MRGEIGPNSGVTYIGPRAFVAAFVALCALFGAIAYAAPQMIGSVDGGAPTTALSPPSRTGTAILANGPPPSTVTAPPAIAANPQLAVSANVPPAVSANAPPAVSANVPPGVSANVPPAVSANVPPALPPNLPTEPTTAPAAVRQSVRAAMHTNLPAAVRPSVPAAVRAYASGALRSNAPPAAPARSVVVPGGHGEASGKTAARLGAAQPAPAVPASTRRAPLRVAIDLMPAMHAASASGARRAPPRTAVARGPHGVTPVLPRSRNAAGRKPAPANVPAPATADVVAAKAELLVPLRAAGTFSATALAPRGPGKARLGIAPSGKLPLVVAPSGKVPLVVAPPGKAPLVVAPSGKAPLVVAPASSHGSR